MTARKYYIDGRVMWNSTVDLLFGPAWTAYSAPDCTDLDRARALATVKRLISAARTNGFQHSGILLLYLIAGVISERSIDLAVECLNFVGDLGAIESIVDLDEVRTDGS
ncbi:hypothetical protein [Burkholderia cenocepacia]|uniref:hypothetical protein n=1 Tax=Burkholderia cenocepacia TaxID=95486 RepID=UPI002AB24F0D|nr:hypothetical protein [Burkholderia cenocepacia]